MVCACRFGGKIGIRASRLESGPCVLCGKERRQKIAGALGGDGKVAEREENAVVFPCQAFGVASWLAAVFFYYRYALSAGRKLCASR